MLITVCYIFLFVFYLLNNIVAARKSYVGYSIYDALPNTEEQLDVLYNLSHDIKYDFFSWQPILGLSSRVLVAPEQNDDFKKILNNAKINFTALEGIKMLQKDTDTATNVSERYKKDAYDFTEFPNLDLIQRYLNELSATFENYVTVEKIGKSYEERDIYCAVVTNGLHNKDNYVIIVIAGLRAREWLSNVGALYIIKELCEHHEKNLFLLRNIDWIILPVANPDGYEYSHTTDRLWTKTRQQYKNHSCVGANLSKNFAKASSKDNLSNNPCSNLYSGPHPFSEPEAKVIGDLMSSFKKRILVYLSLHSYGRSIYYPKAWYSHLAAYFKNMKSAAAAGAVVMQNISRKVYTIGVPLDEESESSFDYIAGKLHVPYAYGLKMPGDKYSFDPPPEKILPYVSETWAGIKFMVEKTIILHEEPNKRLEKMLFSNTISIFSFLNVCALISFMCCVQIYCI